MTEYSYSDIGLQATPTYAELLQKFERLKRKVDEHELLLRQQSQTPQEHTFETIQTKVVDDNDNGVPDANEDERLFEDSTHRFLIYWYEKRSASRITIGIGVLVLQAVLYSCLLIEAFHLLGRDLVNVQISYEDCVTADPDYPTETINIERDSLVCDVDERNFLYATLAFILMGSFLMYDFFACIKIIFSQFRVISKLAAFAIITVNVYSALVASLFAFQGVYTGSGYDALVNTVGVLFIHEIDEAVFKSISLIKKNDLSCKWTCCLQKICRKYSRIIVVFLFLGGMVFLGWSSISVEIALDKEDEK